MTKPNLTAVAIILDSSGSMGPVQRDTIGGLNTFIEQQKLVEGEVNLTINLFDYDVRGLFNNIPIKTVPVLTEKHYQPNGGTALYDAIGKTINALGEYFGSLEEDQRPSKVIVAIMTDGEENASKKYNATVIKDMITHQTDVYAWQFVFLAANQDSCIAAQSVGIASTHSMNYASSGRGTKAAFMSLSSNVSATRSAGASMAFTAENRLAYDSAAGTNVNTPTAQAPNVQTSAVTPVTTTTPVEPWQKQVRRSDGTFGPRTI
jgi:hypothetical protein